MKDSVSKKISLSLDGNAKEELKQILKLIQSVNRETEKANKTTGTARGMAAHNIVAGYTSRIAGIAGDRARQNELNAFSQSLFSKMKFKSPLDTTAITAAAKDARDREKIYTEASKNTKLSAAKRAEYAKLAQQEGASATELENKAAKMTGAQATLKDVGKVVNALVIAPLKKFGNELISVTKNLIDLKTGIATYSSSSLITNAAVRELRMQYGLSSSQAYGFQTASNLLGIKNEEDLMYMNSDQRELFLDYMRRYANWYDKMESSGVLRSVQEMQLEFEQFKLELSMDFLSWIANNKDTIITLMEGTMNILSLIGDAVASIANSSIFGSHSSGSFSNYELYGSYSNYLGLANNNI